jgi:hypothetical protein
MNDGPTSTDRHETGSTPGGTSQVSASFAGLVLNHTQMALLLLGRAPHPVTGETVQDLGGARMLIDQLDMLEQKTRGNLEPHESQMLRESLTALRMAFVEAANATSSGSAQTTGSAAKPPTESTTGSTPSEAASTHEASGGSTPGKTEPGSAAGGVPEEETRKKFSKKY